MASKVVQRAVERVREAVSDAATGLSGEEYDAFLEELIADAEAWDMELRERARAKDDEDAQK